MDVVKTAKTAGNGASIYNEPLSAREVELLAGWERARRVLLTISDFRAAVGDRAAADVARRLVAKHALERVARGQYLLRPFRSMSRPTAHSAVLLAAAVMQGTPHYVGGLWALRTVEENGVRRRRSMRLPKQEHSSAVVKAMIPPPTLGGMRRVQRE